MNILKNKWIHYITLGIICFFVGKSIYEQLLLIKPSELNISWEFILLSFFFELLARLFVGFGYYQLLKRFNTSISFHISVAISWVSLIGKYIPGKIALIANAIYFLKQYNVPTAIAGIVPILNTLITIIVASVLSIPLLLAEANLPVSPILYIAFVFSIVMILIFTPMWILAASKIIYSRFRVSQIRNKFAPSEVAIYLLIACIQCVLAGISTWLVTKSVFMSLDISCLPNVISITAFSGMMGLLVFFSPAGIGVRDGLFYISLSSITGLENAAMITILLRLMHTITDVGSAVMGFVVLKMNRKKI